MPKVVVIKENSRAIMLVNDDITLEFKEDHLLKNGIEKIYGLDNTKAEIFEVNSWPETWKPGEFKYNGLYWEKIADINEEK